MKYYLTPILALLSAVSFSQTDSLNKPIDTTQIKKKEIDFRKVKVILKDKKKHSVTKDTTHNKNGDEWLYSDSKKYPKFNFEPTWGMGILGLSRETKNYDQSIPAIKPTSNANLELDLFNSINYIINGNVYIDFTKHFGLLTGVGFEFNRFMFEENMKISPKNGEFVSDTVTAFSSYKFKTNYVQVPLMLKFQTSNQDFKVALGGAISYNIGTKVKAEFAEPDAEIQTTIKGNYNIDPIKISLGLRVAYKGLGIYTNYALTPMNKNQILHTDGLFNLSPFSIGICLGGL